MFDKMKQMYDMKKKADAIQKEMTSTHIQAEEQGVTVTMNLKFEMVSIDITEEALQLGKHRLQAAVLSAINRAHKKAESISQEKMKAVMGDLNLFS